jgi:hypothetical protein
VLLGWWLVTSALIGLVVAHALWQVSGPDAWTGVQIVALAVTQVPIILRIVGMPRAWLWVVATLVGMLGASTALGARIALASHRVPDHLTVAAVFLIMTGAVALLARSQTRVLRDSPGRVWFFRCSIVGGYVYCAYVMIMVPNATSMAMLHGGVGGLLYGVLSGIGLTAVLRDKTETDTFTERVRQLSARLGTP